MLFLSNGVFGAALLLSLLVNVLLVCSSVCRPRATDRLQLLRGHAASDSLSMTRSSAAADEDGSL